MAQLNPAGVIALDSRSGVARGSARRSRKVGASRRVRRGRFSLEMTVGTCISRHRVYSRYRCVPKFVVSHAAACSTWSGMAGHRERSLS